MKVNDDLLIHNVNLATMADNGADYGVVLDACVAICDDVITFAGKRNEYSGSAAETVDADGQWLLPGFVDCHTHLVFGGDRADEFEKRLNGLTYQQIAEQGGGIKSTVKATREASAQSLLSSAKARARQLAREGVTTIEVKSGYGLNLETEVKMLEVAKQLESYLPVQIETTFLGAHALPDEYKGDADGYIDYLCDTCIPYVAKHQLASTVDVFCEGIGFSPAQCERVFTAAKSHDLNIKGHVEQLSDLKGARLAASMAAISVDHIEYLSVEDVPRLNQHNTVAVLLPGAFYYLNETKKPPIDALREHQVPMAVATDLNPGSSPIASLLTCANMACVMFKLTPEEALKGITVNAAKALKLTDRGTIAPQQRADLCLWDIQYPAQLVYAINHYLPSAKWVGGKRVD
ncbi:imidazolonepropionase [Aliiglaciecola litoralis]|uniref:Imidazolonepropionase n=1 Tax=Aliiglaciecola litoralis TaxID=582857 RepID=A0ABP3X4I0_9ALTE